MNQKNRLLREAVELLKLIADGHVRPLATASENARVTRLVERITKNLNITPAVKA